VNVVRHQDVRVQIAVPLHRGIDKVLEERPAIPIVDEAIRAIVATHNNVLRQAGNVDAMEPGHASINATGGKTDYGRKKGRWKPALEGCEKRGQDEM
jgi:hypothetical protein